MGGVVSDGRSNSDQIANLIENGYLSDAQIKEILYIIDRGRFLCKFENQAYENRSWRTEDYYLDPAYIYCDVLNSLKLKKAHSVLNISSGVGYFALVASSLIGYQGKFIGIEHCPKIAHYASTRHQNFVHRSTTFDMQEFCEPIFLTGDILKFKPAFAKFDKIFCAAAVTTDVLPFLFTFLKIGATLVVTIDENLLECKRLDEKRFFLKILSFCVMPPLITDNGTIFDLYPKSPSLNELFKTSENGNSVILEYCIDNVPNLFPDSIEQKMWTKFNDKLQLKPQSLQNLCRGQIKNQIRTKFEFEKPDFKLQYFGNNFMTNFKYELQRIQITHLSLTSCCLKRNNYSSTDLTSKLNRKFRNYREAYLEDCTLDNLEPNPKANLCKKCRIIDQMTLIELMDDEYLKTTDNHYRYYLQNRIKSLPLPIYLKKFINYKRSFNLDEENFYSKISIVDLI